jgi:hypothetical protein
VDNANGGPHGPPVGRTRSTFRIGLNRQGNWVALEEDGRCGGLFVGRDEAIRFALSQNGNRHEHVVLVDSPLDLDLKPL